MAYTLAIGLTLFWWAIFAISFSIDRSRYRNCYLLFFALLNTAWAATFLAGENQRLVVFTIFVIFTAAVLIVPFFLIHNGILMMRREGRSLANILSLVFGIAIAAGEISTFIFALGNSFQYKYLLSDKYNIQIDNVTYVVGMTVLYVSVSFLIFMIYSLFLMIIPRKTDFDYLIIHGAGLIDGNKVSKLLSQRLDKAIEVYKKDPTPTIMIPSGGKGGNETVSEARAMADYLIEKGIPEDRIVLEDKSTTTLENIEYSKAIIDELGGGRYIALVTSNYHVYRALRYSRRLGMKCTGIGSHVAFYYWPSALIREYIAVKTEPKHLVFFVLGWAICMMLKAAL